VDVVAPAPVVVVVAGDVDVVVEPDVGAVLLVVVLAGGDVVVVVDLVVVVVVVVVVEVVLVGAGGGVLFSVVPVPALPKIDANGLPEMSSMAVMNMSASTNTMAAVPAMAPQENRGACRAGGIGVVVATRRSVAGASAAALISRRSVSPAGAADDAISRVSSPGPAVAPPAVGADADGDDSTAAASPLAPVAPSLRRRVDESGARTTTCRTASCPRSMDWATSAVPMVAAADPMATPTIVPLTPKVEAMTAAITAPPVEARIWRRENFTF